MSVVCLFTVVALLCLGYFGCFNNYEARQTNDMFQSGDYLIGHDEMGIFRKMDRRTWGYQISRREYYQKFLLPECEGRVVFLCFLCGS